MNVISFQIDFSTAEDQQLPGAKPAFVLFGAAPGYLPAGVYRVICGELYRIEPEEPVTLPIVHRAKPDASTSELQS